MSLLTQISNKIQYTISEVVNDPKAEEYAKQKEIQEKHDAEVKAREKDAEKKAKEDAEKKAELDLEAKKLTERSEVNISKTSANIASEILTGFLIFLLIFFVLYGGHLAANDSIGYKIPFRILSFLYGCIFFFIEIPKMFIRTYYYNSIPKYYTFLPLSTYEPKSDLETIFYGWFCYKEDEFSTAARSAVDTLYKTAFDKSQIKTE